MILRRFVNIMLAGGLVHLAACVSGPVYEAPPTGATLSFVQNIEPLRATSRVSATILVHRADAAGYPIFVGRLSDDMLLNSTLLVAGKQHMIEAEFIVQSVASTGRLRDRITFTPQSGTHYQLVISYLDTGYGLRLAP